MSLIDLPVETTIEIATYLDDKDVCSLNATCRTTHSAIGCNGSPLWRRLFEQQFDEMSRTAFFGQSDNNMMRAVYQQRRSLFHLSRYSKFTDGGRSDQKMALQILRALICDSFNGPKGSTTNHSKNLALLKSYCLKSDLLDHVLLPKWRSTPFLVAVQILLSHLSFDLTPQPRRTFSFPESQAKIYGHPHLMPIFGGRDKVDVNLEFVHHSLNFFKHYFTSRYAALEHCYKMLPKSERMQPWSRRLGRGAMPLGKSWKGAYAYMHHAEIDDIRSDNPPEDIEDHWCDNEETFQSLEVKSLRPNTPDFPYPPTFENHLKAKSHPSVLALRKALKRKLKAQAADPSSDSRAPDAPSSAPQTRPKTTRAQLKENPTAVLDAGPETASNATAPPSTQNADANEGQRKRHTHAAYLSSALPFSGATKSTPLILPFAAHGMDEESFLASGHVSALPLQQGIPGWQRFTMMKYFCPEDITQPELYSKMDIAELAVQVGLEGLWCYEGVVLPGGNVVVGRWWSPASGDGLGLEAPLQGGGGRREGGVYSGPFLWWCVD